MDTQRTCPSCGKPLAADAPQGICPECLMKAGFGTASGTEGAGDSGFVPPAVEAIAKLFPQLEVLELIGRGGMGAVYKARQPGLDRLVALKILPPRAGGDPGFAERFMREARALARLSHPNIVAVYDFGQVSSAGVSPASAAGVPPVAPQPSPAAPRTSQNEPTGLEAQRGETLNPQPPSPLHYFLMEYVDGPNLRQVERAGKLTPPQALLIIPQICEALQFAHEEGIVHRDIKPENVLLDKKGRVKIADFGLAKILGREPQDFHLTVSGQVMGTPNYMAPEQVEHPQAVDHRADIYSLGVVFYEMLTGELPLGRFAPPSRKVQVDVRLDEVVLRTLEKEPERRYQTASEVKTALETVTAQPGQAAPPVAPAATVTLVPAEERIHRQVKWPAIGLAVTAGFNWVLLPVFLGVLLPAMAKAGAHARDMSKLAVVGLLATPFVLCSLNIYAALRMIRLEAFGAAIAASIFAMLITPGNLIGFPVGIWALVVLARPEVREAFRKRKAALAAAGTGASARTPLWFWLLVAAPVVMVLICVLARGASIAQQASVPIGKVAQYKAITVELERLNRQERALLTKYTPSHPLVQATRRSMDDKKGELAEIESQYPALGHGEASSRRLTIVKVFNPPAKPISGELTLTEDNAWAVSCTNAQTYRLFEVPDPGIENCTVMYRAKLKSEGLVGRAYLEMWCQLPGQGESFSRGLNNTISGSSDWATCQTRFFLKAGEKPDLIRLNLVVEGPGRVFIKDVELTAKSSN
jgi:serine/threonine protein kinase